MFLSTMLPMIWLEKLTVNIYTSRDTYAKPLPLLCDYPSMHFSYLWKKKYTLMLDFWYVSELALCNNSNGTNYSRMDQVKFVEDSL